jgi:hypothetical protein
VLRGAGGGEQRHSTALCPPIRLPGLQAAMTARALLHPCSAPLNARQAQSPGSWRNGAGERACVGSRAGLSCGTSPGGSRYHSRDASPVPFRKAPLPGTHPCCRNSSAGSVARGCGATLQKARQPCMNCARTLHLPQCRTCRPAAFPLSRRLSCRISDLIAARLCRALRPNRVRQIEEGARARGGAAP